MSFGQIFSINSLVFCLKSLGWYSALLLYYFLLNLEPIIAENRLAKILFALNAYNMPVTKGKNIYQKTLSEHYAGGRGLKAADLQHQANSLPFIANDCYILEAAEATISLLKLLIGSFRCVHSLIGFVADLLYSLLVPSAYIPWGLISLYAVQ